MHNFFHLCLEYIEKIYDCSFGLLPRIIYDLVKMTFKAYYKDQMNIVKGHNPENYRSGSLISFKKRKTYNRTKPNIGNRAKR